MNLFVSTLLIPTLPKIPSLHLYSSIGACPFLYPDLYVWAIEYISVFELIKMMHQI